MVTEKMARVIQLLPTMNDVRIAREVGLSRERVRQIRLRYRVPVPEGLKGSHCRIITEEELGLLIYDIVYTALTQQAIMDKYGITRTMFVQLAKEAGVYTKHRKYKRFKATSWNARFTKKIILECYRRYEGDIAFRQKMCDELGTQHNVVNHWLKKLNEENGMDITITDGRSEHLRGLRYGRHGKKRKEGASAERVPCVQGEGAQTESCQAR